jgi:hypothetical protein
VQPRGKTVKEVTSHEPDLMTEEELIVYLRIPEISKSTSHHNVIENLKRMHQLPRIHICGKPLYPREAVREWIRRKTTFVEQPLAPQVKAGYNGLGSTQAIGQRQKGGKYGTAGKA